MGISKAADYAILAVGYLATNREEPGGAVKSKSQLARSLNLPREFLSQILQKLTKADILTSERGVRGGYFLRKPAEETTFREVIEAIDGESKMVECLSEDFKNCGRLELCDPIIRKMAHVQTKIQDVLDDANFGDITIQVP